MRMKTERVVGRMSAEELAELALLWSEGLRLRSVDGWRVHAERAYKIITRHCPKVRMGKWNYTFDGEMLLYD
mgnify:CR=1 FL=1